VKTYEIYSICELAIREELAAFYYKKSILLGRARGWGSAMAHAAQISPLNRRLRQVHSAPNKIVLLLSYFQGYDVCVCEDKFHLRKLNAKSNNLYLFMK
jgi:hypothetical protein